MTGDKLYAWIAFKTAMLIYSVFGKLTKYREKIQNFRGRGVLKHPYRNELDNACFVHDAPYSDNIDLAKITVQIRFWNIEIKKLV